MLTSRPPPDPISILVTGATSQIGCFLLPRLLERGFKVHALSRTPPLEDGRGVIWHRADIENGEAPLLNVDCIIHLARLPMLTSLLPLLNSSVADSTSALLSLQEGRSNLQRIIAFSSTSRFSKQNSSNADERALALSLAQAEQAIASFCEPLGIAWTVFRPTLIYGGGLDKNITVITNFIRRFGFFPLIGEAKGLRQPVHADDLAAACLSVMDKPATFNCAYNLSGGETLSYREMVKRIFVGMGKPPRFLRIPLPVFQAAIGIVSLLPHYHYLSREMAQRMNQDLCFDHGDASRDFGYLPREFDPPKIVNLEQCVDKWNEDRSL